jgi:putative ABC transport system substrate-binding protein
VAHWLSGRRLATARATLVEVSKSRVRELGYAASDYVLDSRWAEGYDERLSSLAADLVRDKPDVIVTVGPLSAFAAAGAMKTIPIVVVGVGDPAGTGAVPSLARPPASSTVQLW